MVRLCGTFNQLIVDPRYRSPGSDLTSGQDPRKKE